MTDAWDPSIPEHKEIAHKIEVGNGIAEMRTWANAKKAIKTVGYEVLHEEDLAERPDEISWYYPLEVRKPCGIRRRRFLCRLMRYLGWGDRATYARLRPPGIILRCFG
jgi:hypothetical protein